LSLTDEGARIMRICNSCRYCEGYCAVFPAIERRTSFAEGDLNYLANLCHNCSECLYACQYAPPHEFAVNVPKLLSEIRTQSYRKYAGRMSVLAIAGFTLACLAWLLRGAAFRGSTFYAVVPHGSMIETFGFVSIAMLIGFAVLFVRFWRDSGERISTFLNPAALVQAAQDSLTLRYLDGGGGGCTYPEATQSQSRRWMHHLTFYGFGLCFASTCTAGYYHYFLDLRAPYALASLPVLLGTSGGILLTIGTAGLLLLKTKRNPETQSKRQTGADVVFSLMLLLSAVSGLLLLAFRATRAMPPLLVAHLLIVLLLFVTLPWSKFVHAIYRPAALLKYALEGRRGVHRS
jgi:citrate/tricarballylate utilization protein